MRLFWVLLGAGAAVIVVHEFLYRRFVIDTDFEFGGLITHAGVDMAIQAVIVAFVGLGYTGSPRRDRSYGR